MLKSTLLLCWCLATTPYVSAQTFEFSATAVEDPSALSEYIRGLAQRVIAVYRDDDQANYLDTLFRLQIVAGDYRAAIHTFASLRGLSTTRISSQAAATDLLYSSFAQVKSQHDLDEPAFNEALQESLRETLASLDDRASAMVVRALSADRFALERTLDDILQLQKGKAGISLDDAVRLVQTYQAEQAFKKFAPFAAALTAEEDLRRYIFENDIKVRTPDSATLCAQVVRPRFAPGRLPTLLLFTIYDGPFNVAEARRTASNGYVGVIGLSRGKGCSPDDPVAFEDDGADAAALIDWIGNQPWSDGRVGMYGGSYAGFTQWAAVKHRPKALKAIMPSVTGVPGIDTPMEGGVHQSFSYYWPLYTTSGHQLLDDTALNDRARWNRLFRTWYLSGKSYRSLDTIDGTPNPVWNRWLNHPSYDAYWQNMVTYGQDFAGVDIPVLTTTGYYDGAQVGALYYFVQHYKYRPTADHYLVIGPYDHISGQRGTVGAFGGTINTLQGYHLDPIAQMNIGELRYQWFNYIFKHGSKPELLRNKVNFEVMGANVWKHASSLKTMGDQSLRFYLSTTRSVDSYRLSESKSAENDFIPQAVDFADRTDVDRVSPSNGIIDKRLDAWNGLTFVSDPFLKPTELSGLFSGQLDFITNKKDFDFNIQLYEFTDKGEYMQLSWCLSRASYVMSLSHRQLLAPGKLQRLTFTSGRLTSRQFQPGSRLVVVLSIVKEPDIEINYGTGRPVSEETIADAKQPLQIKWFGQSFIEVPVTR
jgi:putative CocE/NonD family hydrolase